MGAQSDKKPTPNVAAVRSAIDNAEPMPELFRDDPEPGQPRNGMLPGKWEPDALGLPPDCPVIPLGFDGDVLWLLDPQGQLCAYTDPFGQGKTALLFKGRLDYLKWAWPKRKKVGENDDGSPIFKIDGWKNEDVRDAMIQACAPLGPWHAQERVRGRGTWRGPGGDLVIHCGHKVVLPRLPAKQQNQPPGMLDELVYPARPAIPRPDPGPIDERQNPAKFLRPLLERWNWARGRVDAHLLMGWIGAAYLGAALDQRPVIYMVGDKGVGKSEMQKLLKKLFGSWLIHSDDTTAAGIYQQLGQDCLPVAIDEFEGKADSRKAKAVLELARAAYSGGKLDRGGDRHQGVQFMLRSAFLFSSINTPPLEPQDLSRLALLRLQKLPPGARYEPPSDGALEMIGRQILRRVIDQWERFPATLKAYRDHLQAHGMDARGCDTFGTLLACADLIEHDGFKEESLMAPDDGDMRPWGELLAIASMIEFEDAAENWRGCLDYMLGVPVEAWRNGTRKTVGQMLEAVWEKEDGSHHSDIVALRRELSAAGLGFVRKGGRDGDWLAVPNQDPALRRLFDGTKWQGEPGASMWAGALRQAPRGDVYEVDQTRINGRKAKCTLIKLSALYGPGGMMTDDEPPDPRPASSMGPPSLPDP
ncbi:MAG TPA: hypothetical protein PK857_00515 [Hyphomicrobium sp.]|nr:hypothetical protein [Hyphomicrobium sp.]HRO48777.1 hypothetical protein [Hyphomicrobium sp.]